MNRRIVILLLAAPVLVTAFVVGGAQWNRSDGRGPIHLTQREVSLTPRDAEHSAATLWLAWSEPDPRATWATRDKLRALGFDMSVDPNADEGDAHYQRQLPRPVYVAFELNGPAWEAVLAARERAEQAGQAPIADGLREIGSRLVPVDADTDATALAARHPESSTHLIARALVRPLRVKPPGEAAYVFGTVANVLPRQIHVPSPWGERLPRRQFEANQEGYEVSVMYGRAFEPWVVGAGR